MFQFLATNFQDPLSHVDLTAGQTARPPQTVNTQTLWTSTTTSLSQKLDLATLILSTTEDSTPSCQSTPNWTWPWMCIPTVTAFAVSVEQMYHWLLVPSKVTNTAKCTCMLRCQSAMDAQITKEDWRSTPTKILDVDWSSIEKSQKIRIKKMRKPTLMTPLMIPQMIPLMVVILIQLNLQLKETVLLRLSSDLLPFSLPLLWPSTDQNRLERQKLRYIFLAPYLKIRGIN